MFRTTWLIDYRTVYGYIDLYPLMSPYSDGMHSNFNPDKTSMYRWWEYRSEESCYQPAQRDKCTKEIESQCDDVPACHNAHLCTILLFSSASRARDLLKWVPRCKVLGKSFCMNHFYKTLYYWFITDIFRIFFIFILMNACL